MSLAKAFAHAHRTVAPIEMMGQRQYVVRVYDQQQRAWHESRAMPWSEALARRREDLVEQTLLYLGYPPEMANSGARDSDIGWQDSVRRFVKRHPL
jgi:hypothetical protein